MKKLGCSQCGGVKKMKDGGPKKPTKKSTPKAYNPFEPQTVSVTKNGKTVYTEPRIKGDKGDNSTKYKYKQQTGGVSIEIPKYSNNPRTQGRILKSGGMLIDPEKKAARQAKRTEKKITKQIKKSVMNSGKIVKAKRGGVKK